MEKGEIINYTKLVYIGSRKHQHNFNISFDLRAFHESIYNGSFSLKADKTRQIRMEDMNVKLDYYNPEKKDL